ncbi:MAG TPA: hypothetical protein VKJ45_17845 [Blastocatellia bacterium]|nr:hypothetical protein [Blastocatellia bacterium]
MAGSSGAGEFVLQVGDGAAAGSEPSGQTRYANVLSRTPELSAWVAKQIADARSNLSHTAQASLEYQGARVSVKFETLTFQDHSDNPPSDVAPGDEASSHTASVNDNSSRKTRYAVIVSPIENSIPEGASLITRQQWHDIKNHLGGLKLYATFLKKKTADGDDQAIVEKMLNGINGLIDHLAQIRGGDAK